MFMWGGKGFLGLIDLSQPSLEVAGGVILLLVAIKMIFSTTSEIFGGGDGREPMIFRLAIPLLAGPSALAAVLLLTSRQPGQLWTWVAALAAAIVVTSSLCLMAETLLKWVGDSVTRAGEKLMGLILTAIAVNMLLGGLRAYFLA